MTSGEVRSQKWIDKIEELVHRAESISDQNARGVTVELLQAVLEFHAAALERVLEVAAGSGPGGEAIIRQIATDDLTSSMLLLHNLHPDDLETRINRAVQRLHDVFVSLGARLSLSAIEPGTVRLCFDSARSWPGAPVKTSIENAIFQAAPEIDRVIIEGLKETPAANFVPVSDLLTTLQVSGSGI
ncbi:MAG TPA: hypothetical protein VLJ11_08465 [Bryobacteraceae bacterium]|nr:hypothetical protein [Bryobacteraceae bacterium]